METTNSEYTLDEVVGDFSDTLGDIADAIRSKTGSSSAMKITDMAAEIASISVGNAGVADVLCATTGISGYESTDDIFADPSATATVLANSTAVSIIHALGEEFIARAISAAAGIPTTTFSNYTSLFDDEDAVTAIMASENAMSIINMFSAAKAAWKASDTVKALNPVPDADELASLIGSNATDDLWEAFTAASEAAADTPSDYAALLGRTFTYTHSNYGSQTVRIIGIGHDSKTDGSGKAGFTFEHLDLPFTRQQNTSNTTSGGWGSTALKTYLEGEFFNGLPAALRDSIAQVNKPCSATKGGTPSDVACKVWIPSEKEIFGTTQYCNEGTRYALYAQNDTAAFRIKKHNNSAGGWWLRSPYSTAGFAIVYVNGGLGNGGAGGSDGVSPCFCI